MLGSGLSIRRALKHLITLSYLAIIIILVTKLPVDVNSFDATYWIEKGKKFAWMVLLSIALTLSMGMSLRMLNKSFKSFFVNIIFIGVLFGSMTYVTLWQASEPIKEWTDLIKIFVIIIWLPLYLFVWEFVVSFFEKNTSPLLSRMVFFKAISHVFLFTMIAASFVLLAQTFRPSATYGIINLTKQSFDFWDPFQETLVFTIVFSFIGYVVFGLYAKFKFNKAIKSDWNTKLNSLSSAVVWIVPLTIWLIINAWFFIPDTSYILFVSANVVIVVIVISFVLLKKSELASQKVFNIIVTFALALVWGLKLFYYFEYPQVAGAFTIIFTLLSTSSIIFMMYYKSSEVSKVSSMTIMSFIFLVFISSIIMWGKMYIEKMAPNAFEFLRGLNLDPIELMNTIVFMTTLTMLLASTFVWTITNMRIKSLAKQKTYKENIKLEEKFNNKYNQHKGGK